MEYPSKMRGTFVFVPTLQDAAALCRLADIAWAAGLDVTGAVQSAVLVAQDMRLSVARVARTVAAA